MRSSDAVDFICVDVMTKSCTVMFTNGGRYEYRNVSRRAMINLLKCRTISLGFWVNQNCINKVNVSERHMHSHSISLNLWIFITLFAILAFIGWCAGASDN